MPRRTPVRSATSRLSVLALAALAGLTLACSPADAARQRRKPAAAAAATTNAADFGGRADTREFSRLMAERHGFDADELDRMFAGVRHTPEVLRLMSPAGPGFKRSWHAYRARFLDPLRLREGQRFWTEHQAAIERASKTWGVPPEIVVSIIGVETIYGRITGDFRVIDSLSTLAFDYPRRSEYFREELEQYLLYTRESGLDAFALRGSFAGAVGLPQFMPGSIRRFAVDFDGDGRIDLRTSPADAVGSVARFLAEHGWVRGEPTHFSVRIADPLKIEPLIEGGIEPRFTLEQLADYGVSTDDAVPSGMPLALIDLPNADRPTTYLLGARNFYAITRYNRSSFYAMAVIELAKALAAAR